VHMSMRSIPPCIPRQWGPISVEEISVWLLQYLPVSLADWVVWGFYHVLSTGRSSYSSKMPGKKTSPDWYPFSSRRVPPIDKAGFSTAVAEGEVVIHSCITHAKDNIITFKSSSALQVDSMEVNVVILCTGYQV
jgi:hypothetical protein